MGEYVYISIFSFSAYDDVLTSLKQTPLAGERLWLLGSSEGQQRAHREPAFEVQTHRCGASTAHPKARNPSRGHPVGQSPPRLFKLALLKPPASLPLPQKPHPGCSKPFPCPSRLRGPARFSLQDVSASTSSSRPLSPLSPLVSPLTGRLITEHTPLDSRKV